MNQNKFTQTMLFIMSNVAYLLIFICVCLSIGYSQSLLMLFNGIFFIVYILNLWQTGIDTYDFYDKNYFFADMISAAIYATIPSLYFRQLTTKEFVCISLLIISINEAVCAFWDSLCHNNTHNEQGKAFHFNWTILTVIGILLNIVFVVLIFFVDKLSQQIWLIIFNSICIIYQVFMLISWRLAERRLLNKKAVNPAG